MSKIFKKKSKKGLLNKNKSKKNNLYGGRRAPYSPVELSDKVDELKEQIDFIHNRINYLESRSNDPFFQQGRLRGDVDEIQVWNEQPLA